MEAPKGRGDIRPMEQPHSSSSNGDSCDLQEVIACLEAHYGKGVEECLLNLYQWGSRVYGTNLPDSDWDFLAVIEEPSTEAGRQVYAKLLPQGDSMEVFVDKKINVTFYTLEGFVTQIHAHALMLMEALFLPGENVWLRRLDDVQLLREQWTLDRAIFWRSAMWETNRSIRNAKKKFANGNVKKGKKELFHAIRYIMFALQILDEGKIRNFAAANEYWFGPSYHSSKLVDDGSRCGRAEYILLKGVGLQEETGQTYAHYKPTYGSLFHHYVTSFHRLCPWEPIYHLPTFKLWVMGKNLSSSSKQAQTKNALTNSNTSTFSTELYQQQYEPSYSVWWEITQRIRSLGQAEFERRYYAAFVTHSRFPQLVQLLLIASVSDAIEGTAEEQHFHQSLQQFSGVIFDTATPYWDVVCRSIPSIPFNSDHALHDNDELPPSTLILEDVDGLEVILYSYQEEWLISTSFDLDAVWKPSSVEPSASSQQRSNTKTLTQDFWESWQALRYALPNDTQLCYIFRFVHTSQRMVVHYPNNRIVLVGVISRRTGLKQCLFTEANKYNWSTPIIFPTEQCTSLAQLKQKLFWMAPWVAKGFIVYFSADEALRLTSPMYIAANSIGFHNVSQGVPNLLTLEMTDVHILNLLLCNMLEFVHYFPTWKANVQTFIQSYVSLCKQVDSQYQRIIARHKDSAHATKIIKQERYASILFKLYAEYHYSTNRYMATLPLHYALSLIRKQ